MVDSVVAPVRDAERIDTLDVLRGIAICGILLMNIPGMGLIGDTALPPLPVRWTLDWVALLIQHMLFSGTMRGLFTMLFGAGMLLMLRRTFAGSGAGSGGGPGQVAPVDAWTRRCLALMALGVVQAVVFMWPGEILWNYGLCGLMLLAFRTTPPRALIVTAAVVLIGASCLFGWQKVERVEAIRAGAPIAALRAAGTAPTEAQKAIVAAFDRTVEAAHPTPAAIADEYRRRTHLPTLIAWSWAGWSAYNLDAESWFWVLESLGFMLIGMALYRTGVLTGAAGPGVYRRLMLIGYPAGLALRASGLWYLWHSGFDTDPATIDAVGSGLRGFLYEPSRLLITLGHVGLIVTVFRGGALGGAWPLRAMGRMALTVYSLQSIVPSVLFYALGYVGAFGFAALMGIAVLIWIGSALFCTLWLKRFATGPAEAVLRRVAYGARQDLVA